MLKTTGCGLFGGEMILGRISSYDVAVHGKKISNNSVAENLACVATGTLSRI